MIWSGVARGTPPPAAARSCGRHGLRVISLSVTEKSTLSFFGNCTQKVVKVTAELSLGTIDENNGAASDNLVNLSTLCVGSAGGRLTMKDPNKRISKVCPLAPLAGAGGFRYSQHQILSAIRHSALCFPGEIVIPEANYFLFMEL